MKRASFLLIAVCFFQLFSIGATAADKLEPKQLIDKLLASTMYVDGTDKTGRFTCWGTAFLIDKEKRLLLTNDHVINPAAHQSGIPQLKTLGGWFPTRRDGDLVHDFKYYVDNVKPQKVTIIYGDKKRDLALIQVDSLPDGLEPLKMAAKSSTLGEQLHSMAGKPEGSEGLWIYTKGTTRAVYNRTLANGFKARTLEADMPTNRGNSGGAVISDTGELVGVVEGHQTNARSVSMYIDVAEVRAFLETANPLVAPKTAQHYLDRGEHHYHAGRFTMAMKDFTKALRLEPKNAIAVSNRGWVFFEQEDLQTAMADFNEALKLDPTMDYAYWGRAMVNYENGDFEQATADMANAIRNCEDSVDLADMYLDRGEVNLLNDELQAALRDCELAVEARPNFGWAHACLGQAQAYMDRLKDADESFERATKLDPENSDIYNLLGTAFEHIESYDNAIKRYTVAIKLNDRNPIFFTNRARSLRELGQYKSASEDLAVAMKLAPDNAEIVNELGVLFYRAGDYPAAHRAFSDAVKLDPQELVYLENRGDAAMQAGDLKRAINDFTEVIQADANADTYALRGKAHQLSGNTVAANADYEQALKLAPNVYRKYSVKYLEVFNDTNEPIRVNVQWYTKSKSGKYRWYPDDGKSFEYFDFQPGQKSVLISTKEKKVYGAKFRIWATGLKTRTAFNSYKDKDFVVVLEGGYVTDLQEPETVPFRFYIAE